MAKPGTKQVRPPLTDDELGKLMAADIIRLKLTDDEKARLRLVNQQKSLRRAEKHSRLQLEQQPLIADLRALGMNVTSVWDLVNTTNPYPEAIPILLDHLPRGYSDRITEGIARALAVREARSGWASLVSAYKTAPMGYEDGILLGAKDGLALALSAAVTDDVIDDLIALARDRANAEYRVLLLRGLRKSKTPQARKALEELASDPDLAKEIASWSKRQKRET